MLFLWPRMHPLHHPSPHACQTNYYTTRKNVVIWKYFLDKTTLQSDTGAPSYRPWEHFIPKCITLYHKRLFTVCLPHYAVSSPSVPRTQNQAIKCHNSKEIANH